MIASNTRGSWLRACTTALLAVDVVGFLWVSYVLRESRAVPPLADLVALVWLVTLALIVLQARARDSVGPPQSAAGDIPADGPRGHATFLAVGVLLALALAFRSAELDRLPWGYAGLHIDAVYNSDLAFKIIDGKQPFMAAVPSLAYVRDTLTHYYLAAFYGLLGRHVEVLRLACNVLALLNCFLVFLILRGYPTSSMVALTATALYAFSGTDAILAISGIEYVIVTPFLLGSFVLFARALRTGRSQDAAVAGIVWGLGFWSHFPYLVLGAVIPAVGVAHWRLVRGWVRTFALGGLVGALPKLCLLVFNHSIYFRRIRDVARHNANGDFFVPEFFWTNARNLWSLLFTVQPHQKHLLPEDPLIPVAFVPLLVVGILVALRDPRKLEHLFVLLITALTVGISLAAFVSDYRFTNFMPFMYLLLGLGLVAVERWLGGGERARLTVVLLVGLLGISSVAAYFTHSRGEVLQFHYGTAEVALAKRIAETAKGDRVYVLARDVTYRTKLFNPHSADLDRPTSFVEPAARVAYSREAEARVLRNVDAILTERLRGNVAIHFVIDAASPYGRQVASYLTALAGAGTSAFEVTDPVSGVHTKYDWVTVRAEPVPRPLALSPLPELFRAEVRHVDPGRRGDLLLTKFDAEEQSVVLDQRRVPARFDFDFARTVPYDGDWTGAFSLRWWGLVGVETTGRYKLETSFDDGCRVFLDRHLILNDWHPGGRRTRWMEVVLEGGWHSIQIDYVQYGGEAHFAFRVESTSAPAAQQAAFAAPTTEPPGSTIDSLQ